MLILSEQIVRACAGVWNSIQANKRAFVALENGFATVPERIILGFDDLGSGSKTLVKPCDLKDAFGAAFGLKVIHVRPSNAALGQPTTPATIMLFDRETGAPECLMNGTFLTALRTASGSALATSLLSRESSSCLVVFGAGLQAEAHIKTVCCVRPGISKVIIVNRTRQRAEHLIGQLREDLPFMSVNDAGDKFGSIPEFEVVDPNEEESLKKAVQQADIICTTTGSATPLFDASWAKNGVHINAVGSYQPSTSELDPQLFSRLDRLVVDTEDAWSAGDLGRPLSLGLVKKEDAVRLGVLLQGNQPTHASQASEITLFKSVGTAVQDIATASQVYIDCVKDGDKGLEVEF